MRPLHLKLTGLQSYREAQEIDFTSITETGVFGIFGPTGSGKSTILDAITLALYGKVERAANNVQGILNHAEDKLFVSFTFALGKGKGERVYRVERSYERSGENTVRAGNCRLLEYTAEGEIVLAERTRELNSQIYEIIGLNVEDFTRAVVLPQGRFAEFLSLKGAERRQMLQRLFSLHRYGDQLNQRLKERLIDLTARLQAISGEQQGLGDASREAVSRAEKFYRLCSAEEKAWQEKQKAVQQEYEVKKRIWSYQQELEGIMQELKAHKQREQEILEAEEKLEEARRAEPLRPLIKEFNAALEDYRNAQGNLRLLNETLQLAREKSRTAKEGYRKAAAAREKEEPQLQERKSSLVYALELEKEVEGLAAEERGKREVLKETKAKAERLQREIAAAEKEYKAFESKEEALQKELKRTEVAAAYREQVQEAWSVLSELKRAQETAHETKKLLEYRENELQKALRSLEDWRKKAESIKEEAAAAQEELSCFRDNRPLSEEDLAQVYKELERAKGQLLLIRQHQDSLSEEKERFAKESSLLEKAEAELQTLYKQRQETELEIENLKYEVSRLTEKEKELEKKNLVAFFARSLETGLPCPVCGSRSHPAPAKQTEDQLLQETRGALIMIREKYEQAVAKFEKIKTGEEYIRAVAEEKKKLLADISREKQRKERSLLLAYKELPEKWQKLEIPGLSSLLERREAELEKLALDKKRWEQQEQELKVRLEHLQEQYIRADKEYTAAKVKLKSLQEAVKEAAADFAEAESQALRKQEELDNVRRDLPVGEIEKELEEIRRKDQCASELKQELERVVRSLKNSEQNLKQKREAAAELAIKISTLEYSLKELFSTKGQKEKHLVSLTGGRPTKELLHNLETRLQLLANKEKEAKTNEEEAERQKNIAESSFARGQSAVESARKRWERAKESLKEGLQKANFPSEGAAADALLPPLEQKGLEEKVNSYREQERSLQHEKRRLEGLLDKDSRLSPKEWERCQQELQDVNDAFKQAWTKRVRAERDLEDLQKKQKKWEELEKKRRQLSKKEEQLNQLRRVLSGNAFVDYIAEERLAIIAREASRRLGELTRYRYALEIDSDGGFIMRDNANGGTRRPVSSLSGGETFLTSLALALSLSAQIQLKGRYPLEFFFLDEGFGSLDPDALELALNTLERLRMEKLTVGIISHVPELHHRITRRVIVEPAVHGGRGSRIRVEIG
ncbi:MAG: AAA family ATPase [Firmicutes bacterium]|jgi:exonuclease SbcC|nr:AAA family ATPase [Bacillota bacterium]